MLLIKMALRNLRRQRRRSFFTGLTMAVGFTLFSIQTAFSEGAWGMMIDLFTRDHTGHAQIHAKGYLDRPSLYKNFVATPELYQALEKSSEVVSAAPRVHGSALAFVDTKTTGVRLIGIDPQRESTTTRIVSKIKEGSYLDGVPVKKVLIGRNIADVLHAKIGGELVLISQAADGSIANEIFTIAAIMGDSNDTEALNNVYMHIADAQEFLMIDSKIHEIALLFKHHKKTERGAAQTASALTSAGFSSLSVEPWQEVEPEFYKAMLADRKGDRIGMFIIMLIVGIGVLNTVLMTVLERTREYGVMRALGTRPARLFCMIVIEMVLLAVIACVVGSVTATGADWYLSVYGIKYPEPVSIGSITISAIKAEIMPVVYYRPAILVISVAFIVSILPALRAARIKPVDALRSF